MDISMNIHNLQNYKLTVNEYLYLRNIYADEKDKIVDLYSIIDHINEDSLQDRGFIKITEDSIILRQKTIELFEPKELFYKYLSIFPIKTPSGRYLSPAGIEGVAVTTLKAKWDKRFKNKDNLQEKAIRVLEAELAWRRKSNNMEYIHNAETWLNQADYEKYEYLLDLNASSEKDIKWM